MYGLDRMALVQWMKNGEHRIAFRSRLIIFVLHLVLALALPLFVRLSLAQHTQYSSSKYEPVNKEVYMWDGICEEMANADRLTRICESEKGFCRIAIDKSIFIGISRGMIENLPNLKCELSTTAGYCMLCRHYWLPSLTLLLAGYDTHAHTHSYTHHQKQKRKTIH